MCTRAPCSMYSAVCTYMILRARVQRAHHTIVQLNRTSRKLMRIINGLEIPHECSVLHSVFVCLELDTPQSSIWTISFSILPLWALISFQRNSFVLFFFLCFYALCRRAPTLTDHIRVGTHLMSNI